MRSLRIDVRLYANLRMTAGTSAESLEVPPAATVREALERLFDALPALRGEVLDELGEVRPFVQIFRNGREIRWQEGLETRLAEGDTLHLFPPIAGG
ncbi:MAG: MoaD/ThiS family protein [Clostridia bacterium]|nr:MoaD/ThiS family protein [Clostridia bacterium]MCL6522582.1 MoaD/ThiS family protein [Bacillota bacterium]